MVIPQLPNDRRSLDFVADQFIDGRRMRILIRRSGRRRVPPDTSTQTRAKTKERPKAAQSIHGKGHAVRVGKDPKRTSGDGEEVCARDKMRHITNGYRRAGGQR